MTRVAVLLMVALAAGCLRPDPDPRFTPAWEEFDPDGEGWIKSGKVLLVADCQFHNLYSDALPERNLSSKAMITTAIRSPQLDLFSADVLRWILKNGAPDADIVLHLGDALDLGCDGEFTTFVKVMEASPKPWYMAPGNHDSYYFGNYHPEKPTIWEAACKHAGKPLHKDRFIRYYVAALLGQKGPDFDALADGLGLAGDRELPLGELAEKIPGAFEWQAPEGTKGFLKRICWKTDPERPWRSFILQAGGGAGGKARVLLMDSCQYARQPQIVPNGWRTYPLHVNCGATGEMLPDQLRKARAWLEAEQREYVVMCHHPFESLAPRSKSSLGWLWRERKLGMLVSAHTHKGYYAHHDLGGGRDEIELNIGSTTDWPMEWRTLRTYVNREEKRVYVEARRGTMANALRHRGGFFHRNWEIPLDAPDDYRKYKSGETGGQEMYLFFYLAYHLLPYWLPQPLVTAKRNARQTEREIKNTMLWTYYRLITTFPTAPDAKDTVWPEGCASDADVLMKITSAVPPKTDAPRRERLSKAEHQKRLDQSVALLKQLELFERSRRTINDEWRAHYKISQAVWASRFESARGRRLSIEDDLIEVDWKKTYGDDGEPK